MKHLFLPYELSLIAKEKGFDEECFAYYRSLYPNQFVFLSEWHTGKRSVINSVELEHESYYGATAPLYQQIIDWFREKHGVVITITYTQWSNLKEEAYTPHIEGNLKHKKSTKKHYMQMMWASEDTYYEAANIAIEEAFKLI